MAASTKSIFTFKYVDHSEVIGIGAALPAISIGIVALRFYTRMRQTVKPGIDDWLILCGLTCFIGMGACLIDGAARGAMGYPTPLPPDTATKEELLQFNPPSTELIGKLQFAFQLLMVICYGFVKTSIVYFYRRIFVTHNRTPFSIITHIINIVLILWSLTFIFIIIFPCGRHVYANWGTPASQMAYCEAIGHTSEEGLAGSDLILDFVLLILPIPSIWRLQMSITRKVSVTFIMALGLAALAASIARLVLYVQLIHAAVANQPVDQNQVLTLSMYWSTLEVGLALIAACLPSLSSLFTRTSLQSAVRSVRSVLSLRSSKSSSKGSKPSSTKNHGYRDLEANSRASSGVKSIRNGESMEPTEYDPNSFELVKKREHGAGVTTWDSKDGVYSANSRV